jgi:hypothetical protein
VPFAFVAVTVNVYAVPFVRPIMIAVVLLVVVLKFPTFEVTVYDVIGEPPLNAGADHERLAEPFPAAPARFVGASGIVDGVVALLAVDAVLVPFAFVAVTVNVYAVPFVRPVIVIGDDPPVAVAPVFEVTVYLVIVEPPLLGALNEIVAVPFPLVAVTFVGVPGGPEGTTELLVPDDVLVPTAFVAVTVNVYVVPFVRPVTVIVDDPPVAVMPPTFEVTVYEVIDAPPLFVGGVNVTVA